MSKATHRGVTQGHGLLKLSLVILILLGVAISAAPPSQAEGITQEQGDAILKELKGIRQLLQQQQTLLRRQNTARRAPAADPNVTIKLVDTYAMGSDKAPVTLVEFTDYQCPYCSRFHTTTFPQLKKNFIDTGKVRFISRDLPLHFHKNAFHAARAARCAGEQDKYWEVRHVLSSNPKNLSEPAIIKYAEELQLEMDQFQACLDSEKYKTEINKDIADANAVGITGTPGFIIGRTPTDGTLKGIKVKGAQGYASFAAKINKLLANGKQQAPAPTIKTK